MDLVSELFATYMAIKRLRFYLMDAECAVLCDQKHLEKFLKGKKENNKVSNWSVELSFYKLKIQYIKGPKNVLADCHD